MMKRLTAWLLVLCMTLSLLPGTAFAASGGGDDDGLITVYYDLNDGGKSTYRLKMKTKEGEEPRINPGAVWAGRPFAGWMGDRAGSTAAEFKDGAVLYANWQSGYELTLDFNEPENSPTSLTYTTDNNGKLKERDLAAIDNQIAKVESLGKYSFEGWYVAEKKGEYEKDDLFTKQLTTDTVIPANGFKLYAKWASIYTINFDYDMTGKAESGQSNPPIETTTGGVLSKMPKTPAFKDDGYDFEAWYIIEEVEYSLPGSKPITEGQLPRDKVTNKLEDMRGVRIPHDELSKFSFTEIAEALKELKANNQISDDSITLVANWQLPAGIVFHANGGHFGSDEKNYRIVIKTDENGELRRLPNPDPEKDGPFITGYKFIGWYKADAFNPTGTPPGKDAVVDKTKKEVEIGDKFSGPTTVYAAWEKLMKVTINFGTGDLTPVTLYVPHGQQLSSNDYKQYLEDLTVKGYTVGDLFTIEPEGGMPENQTLEQIKTYSFTADTTIKVNLIKGYLVNFWTEDENGTPIKLPYPAGDPTGKGNWYTNTQGHLINDATNMPSDPQYPNDLKSFIDWYTADGKPLPQSTFDNKPSYGPFEGEQNFYAHWGAPFKITFQSNTGGNIITEVKTDKAGKIPIPLPTPTSPTEGQYKDYVFEGWHLKQDLSDTAVDLSTPAQSEPPVLYAKWIKPIQEIPITYDPGTRGTVTTTPVQDKTTLSGQFPPSLPQAVPDDVTAFRFGGWFTKADGQGTMINAGDKIPDDVYTDSTTGAIHLFAYWIPTTRATNSPSSTFAMRPTADVPSLTAAAGEFDITLTDKKGGTLPDGSPLVDKVETEGKKLPVSKLPEKLVKDGYEFVGWFSAETGGTKITTSTQFFKDTEIFARWESKIIFAPGIGNFPDAPDALYKELVTTDNRLSNWPTDPVCNGQRFLGWYDENDKKVSENQLFPDAVTLTAKWEPIKLTITFDRNDGTGTYVTKEADENGLVTDFDSIDDPERTGYDFDGWFTEKEGGTEVTSTYVFTADATVYAHWRKLPVITFDPDNGENPQVLTVDKDGNLVGYDTLDPPKRAGYKFDEWYTARNGGGNKFDSAAKFTQDATFYANWIATEYTIHWKTKSDSDIDTTPINPATIADSETVGGYIPSLPQITRKGYRFGGWWTGDPNDSDETKHGIQITTDTPIDKDTTLTAKWIDLTTTEPENPVVTFIVDIAGIPDDAAHFTLETNSSHQLEQLPVLDGIGKVNGWRLEDGSSRVTETEVYNSNTNLYVYTAQTYSVTFDWNDAEEGGTSNKTIVETNADGQIDADKWPNTDNARPGYHFDDWYTEATGGEPVLRLKTFTEDTTIYAHWVGPYTITFDANGGAFPDGETKKEAETDAKGNLDRANIPEDPSREGYGSFVGWSLTADGTEEITPSGQPYEKATTLYAIWGPPYDITYDAMGGEVTPTEEQLKSTEEGKYPELPVPTHTRDSFGGWYTTQDYQEGTQATAGGDCPGAVTLYAKWTREPPYTITFEANREGATMEDPDSGAAVTTITLKTDDKGVLMKAPPEPMLRGGKFQGWYTKAEEGTGDLVADAATRTYTDDTTLYAHWETMEFKITFDFNLSAIMSNPTNVTTYTTTKGGSLTYLPGDLPQASSGDKKISGWYRVPNPTAKDQPVTKSDVFYRDTTLYAQWVDADDPPIVFKYPNITFMNEDGNKAMITLEVDTDYKLATFPEPPYKEGHTFTGWVTRDPDGTEHPLTSDTLITGSLVAYPKYAQKGYTITFEPGEETELDPTKVTTTSEGRIPDGSMPDDPVWEGHTFNGWYTSATGGTKINRRTVFTQDTTVYAHWDGSDGETPSGEYTITFDADGGSVTPTSATTVNGKLQILPTPTKSGYTFDGWYNGTSAVTVDTVYTADTTLTAHWKSDGGSDGPSSAPYTITFNPNGGNLETAATALTDLQGRLMSIPTPRRTGYSFDGWYNGTERVTTATVFTKNTEVVARWTTGSGGGSGSDSGTNGDNGYTVTVNNNSGGRVSVSTTYAREGDRVTVTIRPYTGYQLDQINVTNARGYDVSLRDQGGNRYTFYMPASRVTVDATFMELIANGNGNGDNGGNNGGNTGGNTGGSTGGNGGTGGTLNPITPPVTSGNGVFSEPVLNTVPMPYVDVTPSAWYYSSVDYMWQRSLMGGVSANRFGPQATTSNAMIWTILARLAGVDVTAGGGIWYENARSWAVSNRISDGVGPNNAVTREQLATMLWNYRGSPAASYDLGRFGDRGEISTYQAENALRWAVANNIVSGSGNRLNPRGTATRAEVAAMITRFCQNT